MLGIRVGVLFIDFLAVWSTNSIRRIDIVMEMDPGKSDIFCTTGCCFLAR